MNYEELLDEAYENMPESVLQRERFEVPKATGFVEGTKTSFGAFILPDMKCWVLRTCAEISSPTTVPLEIVKRDPSTNRQTKDK